MNCASFTASRPARLVFALTCVATFSSCARNGIVATSFEQSYLGASHNRAFRERFPRADRLFNGFDYGHAILYETLLTSRAPATQLEGRTFAFVTKKVLTNPPDIPLEEAAIGPAYTALVPEISEMFEWAHILHRQIYDIWSMPGWTDAQRDREVARVVSYYRSRRDLAFSSKPKSMTLMEGQPYSLTFRREAPKYNGLLWSYHWLQMVLYESLMQNETPQAKFASIDTVVNQFFQMIDSAPSRMPTTMPMSDAVAPHFSARYPEAAIIFDNLHSLHDVVSDILATPTIPKDQKRRALLLAAAAYRDDTTSVISIDEWRAMSRMMHMKHKNP